MSTISFTEATATAQANAPSLVGRARRRAMLRLGWYLHAAIFVLINLALAAGSVLAGEHGVALPSLGWSLGLGTHGLAVLLIHLRLGLLEHMVRHERALRNMG